MADGAESVRQLCEIAAGRGLLVDMHCDESDDPLSRHIESLAYETQRLGLQGRVTGRPSAWGCRAASPAPISPPCIPWTTTMRPRSEEHTSELQSLMRNS